MDNYIKLPLSRKFEYLIKDLLKLELGLQENDIIVTQMTRDGGRDVEFEIETMTHLLPKIKDKVWVEAKLRSAKKVQLNDIAGNIIIATNSNVQKIYFVSNHYFSNQAISELILLRLRTGLSILLIDGFQVNLLIEHWNNELSKYHDIIPKLRLPTKKDSTTYEHNIAIDLDNYQLCRIPKKKRGISKFSTRSENHEIKKIFNIDDVKVDIHSDDAPAINKDRETLLEDIIDNIKQNKVTFLRGEPGQGKTFVLSKASFRVQCKKWIVHKFEITPADTIISFTKNVIVKISNIDYISVLSFGHEELILFLVATFDVSESIANEMSKLLTRDFSYGSIPAETCLSLILNLIFFCNSRKKFLLVIDDIHNADEKLYPFLINLFDKLFRASIPVLVSIDYQKSIANEGYHPKHFINRTLDNFSHEDLVKFIEINLPGANNNVIDLVLEKSMPIPSDMKIFMDYIINKQYVKSVDNMYYVVDNIKRTYINSQESNSLDSVVHRINSDNKAIQCMIIYLYLFNNKISLQNAHLLIDNFDEDEILECPLFRLIFENNICYISFLNMMYFNSATRCLKGKSALLQKKAYQILQKCEQQAEIAISPDILGNLYEHIGDFSKGYVTYMNYGKQVEVSSPKLAAIMLEKALSLYMHTFEKTLYSIDSPFATLFLLIFDLMRIYDKLNMLAFKNAMRLFEILERYKDNGVLQGKNIVLYLYYLGKRETTLEHFQKAQTYFQEALSAMNAYSINDEGILYMVNVSYGIDLKHLGRREESIMFFENLSERYGSMFKYEQESNMAAFHLSLGEYEKALRCYHSMKQLGGERQLHLDIDFAMTYFYMNRYEDAMRILEEVIPLTYDTINLSETARAYNIKAAIHWMSSEYKIAEGYFDKANAVGEMSNNYRWLWRIRINQAQIALQNGNKPKAKNICYNVIDHLSSHEDSIAYELLSPHFYSKRYSALKAVCLVFDKIDNPADWDYLFQKFPTLKKNIMAFSETMPNLNQCETDPNFYKAKGYIILG